MSYTPKKTPLEKHADRFIRDYPKGLYERTESASRKKRTVLKQSRTPRRVIKRGANIK